MEVTIERILPGGFGLAHADGRTIMVALATAGDRARIRVDRVKGNVSFASIEEIITPSPHRVEPPCPYFGRCGGFAFSQTKYPAPREPHAENTPGFLRRAAAHRKKPCIPKTPAPHTPHPGSRARQRNG